MTFIDLFAGIGGFRRGMELAGHTCVGFCEWDKYATASYTSMHLITNAQREKLAEMPLKQRQKEILKEEYRNGEWYANDIRGVCARNIPKAECWGFGAPCQDFSVAGKRAGLGGDRSSLVREVFRILEELKEEDRPEWLVYENVKGMLSSNSGLDYLSILCEMDRLGYDLEWQNINTAWFLPQNRERIYTIGHLRVGGTSKVLPITGTDGENCVGIMGHRDGYRRNTQVFSPECITEALDTAQGGGIGHHVGITIVGNISNSQDGVILDPSGISKCHGVGHNNQPKVIQVIGTDSPDGITVTLLQRDYKEPKNIAIPVLTPDRANKRQNGRRFKENGETMFTLTAQDRHGVMIEENINKQLFPANDFFVNAIWNQKMQCYVTVRKLTPKECFRLQGWTDDYFAKAQFVNSDSQLYKQAGNGISVPVVAAIGKKMG